MVTRRVRLRWGPRVFEPISISFVVSFRFIFRKVGGVGCGACFLFSRWDGGAAVCFVTTREGHHHHHTPSTLSKTKIEQEQHTAQPTLPIYPANGCTWLPDIHGTLVEGWRIPCPPAQRPHCWRRRRWRITVAAATAAAASPAAPPPVLHRQAGPELQSDRHRPVWPGAPGERGERVFVFRRTCVVRSPTQPLQPPTPTHHCNHTHTHNTPYQGGSSSLALPHLSVPDPSVLDWAALKAAGFTGAVFDKDNTLTAPYSPRLTAAGAAAVAGAAAAWGPGGVALLSNSAGLAQFDPDGAEADALEAALGVAVIRHSAKKPGGGPAALAAHFGLADPSDVARLVMVGDRYLTDVVYGNRLGLLTVRPAPVTAEGEPRVVRIVSFVSFFSFFIFFSFFLHTLSLFLLSLTHAPSHARPPHLPGPPRGGCPRPAVDSRWLGGAAAPAGTARRGRPGPLCGRRWRRRAAAALTGGCVCACGVWCLKGVRARCARPLARTRACIRDCLELSARGVGPEKCGVLPFFSFFFPTPHTDVSLSLFSAPVTYTRTYTRTTMRSLTLACALALLMALLLAAEPVAGEGARVEEGVGGGLRPGRPVFVGGPSHMRRPASRLRRCEALARGAAPLPARSEHL
jgi:phosphatidylglycerophosphatase GEP4